MTEILPTLIGLLVGAVAGHLAYIRWLGPRWFPELYPERRKRRP